MGGSGGGAEEDEFFWSAVEAGDLAGLGASLQVEEEAAQQALGAALPVLAQWRRRTRDQARTDGWRYRTAWSAVTGLDTAGRPGGTWLLVVPEDRAGDPVAATALRALEDHGATCTVLTLAPRDQARDTLTDRLRQLGEVSGITGVRVVSAPGSGDDTIVEVARDAVSDRAVIVVTADRLLRERVRNLGARIMGPGEVRDAIGYGAGGRGGAR